MGKKLALALLAKQIEPSGVAIEKVVVRRQWEHIDISALINEKYLVVIEDKKNAKEHGTQLRDYKAVVEKRFRQNEIILVYLKTGLESRKSIAHIENSGWHYFSRGDFLKVLENHNTNNAIVEDYYDYLKSLEEKSNSFGDFQKLSSAEATKGLFLWIQEQLPPEDDCDWNYVANPSGGFWGLWYHSVRCKQNPDAKFYLQIENPCKAQKTPKLFVKVGDKWNKNVAFLRDGFNNISGKIAPKYGITVSKPNFRVGKYSSIAIINDVFVEQNGKLDLANLIEKLKTARNIADDLAKML